MPRDDFPQKLKEHLARRVGMKCSNPECRAPTAGPHSDATRSVSIGVASHILAAAPGGPRYDPRMTPAQRSGAENAIWLCQACAKLVDSDVDRYTSTALLRWKEASERSTRQALGAQETPEYFPQPQGAVHAPIPRIDGKPYDEARRLLVDAGWQPRMRHWSDADDVTRYGGNGAYFWELGYWEIINAWPTGLAQCTFAFQDAYRNQLVVVTLGEVIPEIHQTAHVSGWYLEA